MGIFSPKYLYNRKQMRSIDTKHSPVMKDLMQKKKVTSVLEKKSENREFFQAMKDQAKREGGGISKRGMQTILGRFRKGKGKTINKKDAIKLAGELTGGKYVFEKDRQSAEKTTLRQRSSVKPVDDNQSKIDSRNPSDMSSLNIKSTGNISRRIPRF